ncbi:MAG: kinase [Xanthomonadales bacterium]|nr:kinase [Xanthomonadales bacterium]
MNPRHGVTSSDPFNTVLEHPAIGRALAAEDLPDAYERLLEARIVPMARALADWVRASPGVPLLGINGAQASGKSTLALFLSLLLDRAASLRCPVISIDDIYATRTERVQLAQDIHPLLMTRGVPGTHDIGLGASVIEQLQDETRTSVVRIPRFDKSADDRCAPGDWTRWAGPAHLVILEGWCVGCPPQDPEALEEPVNQLERDEDPGGEWRHFVNRQLQGPYARFFDKLDRLIMLRAPGFECVFDWRLEQERKLEARLAREGRRGERLLNEETLRRFLDHYERLTTHMLQVLPPRADTLVELDKARGWL